jgi:hypothetical protein
VSKLTKEHREKIGAANATRWANRTPEEQAALTAKRKKAVQLATMRGGNYRPTSWGPVGIDPDFDEGL